MYDGGPALLAWKMDHLVGGATTEISDYLPKFEQTTEEIASVSDVFKEFGGVKRRG